MAAIPELKYTPLDAISDIVHRVRSTFYTQKTRPLAFRLVQLRKLYWGRVFTLIPRGLRTDSH